MKFNKLKQHLKKLWSFATHHNAIVVALESAIFAGVIFALAAENIWENAVNSIFHT